MKKASTVKKSEVSSSRSILAKRSSPSAAPAKAYDSEGLNTVFLSIGQKLREGKSSEAERVVTEAIDNGPHKENDLANLKRLLSFTLETVGRYKDALDAIKHYEDEEILNRLNVETQVRVTTQLGIAFNNIGDHPKAVTLLKSNLDKAKSYDLSHLFGSIEIGLARVYRKLNETPICRGYAESSLNHLRITGDWLGMAEAYREIAISYHQEGDSEKALEYFNLGLQIVGDRSAPFMLGKLYTDMSGAFWFLRRSKEGIECLEKSIEFFDQTEHVLNSIIAYNNLGIHQLHLGEWNRAEQMIMRALDLARQTNHVHVSGILDSLGELKILRGELDAAEELLEEAVRLAAERKREWYQAQAMRNLARCLMAKGQLKKAALKAKETISLAEHIGDSHHANMAGLVLAETSFLRGDLSECESALTIIEDGDPASDLFVLGNIQRIRGLMAQNEGDDELAAHHFNRALTVFETAEDIYYTAVINLLLGKILPVDQKRRAVKHLTQATDIFKRLGLSELENEADTALKALPADDPEGHRDAQKKRVHSSVSQLLMVRLAEATASRELLFRELVSVLQQESRAKRIIIAEYDVNQHFNPFITHGYTPSESTDLVRRYEHAKRNLSDKEFLRSKDAAVFPIKPTNAAPALLIIQPREMAVLNDDNALAPLLRVVELGMDVISLREKERKAPVEKESNAYTSNNILPGFIHSSPAMTSLVEEIYKIRSSDVTVLVTGESGTGKELVSRAIHTISSRKDMVFIPFNCTAVPKELAEGHLFGYRKGAFTGAVSDSPGVIRSADGGTLFLDEIGDLPLDVQPKLLRFLQEGEVQPIGEKKPIKVDVRVIAATNTRLEEMVAEGTFREDLFYRLNVIRLRVPPLRERRSEIPPIVNHYIDHYSKRFGKRDITFTPQTIDLLMVCNWEGNVRQLSNEIQRIIARSVDGEIITPDHLSPELKQTARPISAFTDERVKPITSFDGPITPFTNISSGSTLEDAVSELEMQMIKDALTRHRWNISRVANELGLTRRGLYLKLTRYGIEKAT